MTLPLNVLIVEDRPADAELVVLALEQADFAVTWRRVDTERDYLAGLGQDPDVILSDHSLPQYDSIRALRALKTTGRDIPFLIVSGTINEELAVCLLKEGASDYVLKDRLKRLGPAVAQSLEQQRLRRQRLRAEEDLRASEARFKALIEHSVDGIVLLDATGAVLYGSPSSALISGYAADELLGRNVRDFLGAEDTQHLERLLTGGVQSEGKSIAFESRIRHQDGSWRWAAGTLTNLLAEPSVRAIVGNYRDITAYHEAQEAVRQSEQRLRLAIDAARLGRWEWTVEAELTVWLPIQETISEVSGEVLHGSVTEFMDRVDPDDLGGLVAAVVEARQKGSAFQHECRVFWPDGSVRWLAGRGHFVGDGASQPVRMMGVFMDVSERKATEERLRVSLAEKEVLLREVHHRVKNNLQVICSLLQMQADYANGADPRELLRESQGRVRSMALAHERLYRAGDLSRIDLAEYLRGLATSLFHTYQTGNRVRLAFELESVSLNLDAAMPCGLVINELLSNALKHAFPNGRSGEVRVSLLQTAEGQADLTVADDGVGLPKHFDVKAPSTFGFRLIAALVGQLHGTLEIGGQEGARVRIRFPLQSALVPRNGVETADGNGRHKPAG